MLLSICFKFQKNSIVLFAEVHFPCQREISISSSSKIHTCALHLLLALFGWKYCAIQLLFLLWVYCVVLNLTSLSQTCRVYHKIYISISFFYLQLLGFCGFICDVFFYLSSCLYSCFLEITEIIITTTYTILITTLLLCCCWLFPILLFYIYYLFHLHLQFVYLSADC